MYCHLANSCVKVVVPWCSCASLHLLYWTTTALTIQLLASYTWFTHGRPDAGGCQEAKGYISGLDLYLQGCWFVWRDHKTELYKLKLRCVTIPFSMSLQFLFFCLDSAHAGRNGSIVDWMFDFNACLPKMSFLLHQKYKMVFAHSSHVMIVSLQGSKCQSVSRFVGLSVHFGSAWSISIAIEWFDLKFCKGRHRVQRMSPNDSGDHLTLHLVPPTYLSFY